MSRFFTLTIFMFIIFSKSIHAQDDSRYPAEWKKIHQLEEDGKTKDALEMARKLLSEAEKKGALPDEYKALVYTFKYRMAVEEESDQTVVADLRNKVAQARQPAKKALFSLLLADIYSAYYQSNLYEIADRTPSMDTEMDYTLWGIGRFSKEITGLYKEALTASDDLAKIPLGEVSLLVTGDKKNYPLLPTLYDLLAYKAITYFGSQSFRIPVVVDEFEMTDPSFFAPAEQFQQISVTTADTLSSNFTAFRIFQQWLKVRSNDPVLRTRIDLLRLDFMKEHFTGEDKDEWYVKALTNLLQTTTDKEQKAEIEWLMVTHQYTSQETHSGDPQRPDKEKVIQSLKAIIQQYPGTAGANNAQASIDRLLEKVLGVRMEEAIVPDKPFKVLLEYKDIPEIYYRIVQWKEGEQWPGVNRIAEIWKSVKNAKQIRSGKILLPNAQDHYEHSMETAFEGLPIGQYVLVCYTGSPEASMSKSCISAARFYVTNLSLALHKAEDVYVLRVSDRSTGKPLAGVNIEALTNKWDYIERENFDETVATLITDFKGIATSKLLEENYNRLSFRLQSGEDVYKTNDNYFYAGRSREDAEWVTTAHLFTDRAIYRPGQRIFFKGIVTEKKDKEYRVRKNFETKVTLKDANWEDIVQYNFTTNEYGSFSGFFDIPKGLLNGSMTIYTNFGSVYVQVEEYKRPGFEVLMDTVKAAYKLNDSVTVSGKAMAFSGAVVGEATVRYEVRRVGTFPEWIFFRKGYWPRFSEEKIIAHGELTTSPDGSFSIRFKALPDKKLNPENDPIFNYNISLDITDVNGETQSGNTSVRIGYLSIEPDLQVNKIQTEGQTTDLKLKAVNLQGQPAQANFQVAVYPLEVPKLPKKERYWGEPDQFNLSKEQHDQRFPFDVYANEEDLNSWKAGPSVWSQSVKIFGDTLLKPLLPSGMYKVEAKVISNDNDTITLYEFIEVRPEAGQTILPVMLDIQPEKTTLKSGDQASVTLHSSLKEVLVHYRWMHNGKLLSSRTVPLKGQSVTLTYLTDSTVIGGLDFFYEMTAENRFYKGQVFFDVPIAPLEDLQYQWKTFRNKLYPGSKETWELTILGAKREAVAAELLATMYDASLDQFEPHRFNFSLNMPVYRSYGFEAGQMGSFRTASPIEYVSEKFNAFKDFIFPQYPSLSYFDNYVNRRYMLMSRFGYAKAEAVPLMMADAVVEGSIPPTPPPPPAESQDDIVFQDPIAAGNGKPKSGDVSDQQGDIPKVVFRKNFNETAFFFPQMRTDAEGNIVLSFTMPEALTRWKFLGLAHTQNLHYTLLEDEVVTSKDLMITPNKMRFFRMGDTLYLNARISNLTDMMLSGQATLHLKDLNTDQLLDATALLTAAQLPFKVDAKGSTAVNWKIAVPQGLEGIVYEISATSGGFTDGETDVIPVLENRILLTESLPIFLNKRGRHTFLFDRFIDLKEKSIATQSLVLEYTSNPVWHALMALPYLHESKDASSVSLYNRYYANSLAAFILKQIPQSKTLQESWRKEGNLKSALEKNPELKSVVLEATPWLRDAVSETEQMQQLLQLMDNAAQKGWASGLLAEWKKLQAPNGGLMWYPGMPESRYLTMMFAEGIGHLRHIGAISWNEDDEIGQMTIKMLRYLDDRLTDDLSQIKKTDSNYLKNDHLWYQATRQMYLHSFFKDVPVAKNNQAAYDFFMKQAVTYGLKKDVYSMAQLSLVLHRNQKIAEAGRLLEALRQSAVVSEKEGMYWKSVTNSYSWQQAPIETQALLIEAFNEAGKDQKSVDLLRTWLIRQKQTSRWSNSSATAEACYALLLTGGEWKMMDNADQISIGKTRLKPSAEMKGTGYFKERWEGSEADQSFGEVTIRKKQSSPSWGAMYWQYWQDMDQVTLAQGGLSLKRTIYKVVHTNAGEMLMPVSASEPLQTGDKIKVKLEIRAERDMEFVHIQDSRGSGMEPVDVLSGYQYASGLWYYKVTGDAATHWYIERLNKGTYTMEYTVFAASEGNFSSGVTFGECLYDPSFRGHSTGERVVVNP